MRVLIADDDILTSETLSNMVAHSGHEVIGVVRTGIGAIRSYSECHPDVVLMDFSMSRLNGATASRMILSTHPEAKIVMLSGLLTGDDLSMIDCGAMLKIPKPIDLDRLKEVLDGVAKTAG